MLLTLELRFPLFYLFSLRRLVGVCLSEKYRTRINITEWFNLLFTQDELLLMTTVIVSRN